jgi:hypothetical protein
MFCTWLVTRILRDLCFSVRVDTDSCYATQGGRSSSCSGRDCGRIEENKTREFPTRNSTYFRNRSWLVMLPNLSDNIGRRFVTPKSNTTASLLPFHGEASSEHFPASLWPLKTRFLGTTVSHWPAYIPIICTIVLSCELFVYSEGGGSSFLQSVCALLADYTTLYRWRKQSHLVWVLYVFLDNENLFEA